jgi:hypothetical protein
LTEDGKKFAKRTFMSAKKSLNVAKVSKIVSKTARPADDKKFQAFRRENYYETVQSIKDLKMRQAEEDAIKASEAEAQENAARFARTMKKPSRPVKNYGNKA